jgi:hypothetical protein
VDVAGRPRTSTAGLRGARGRGRVIAEKSPRTDCAELQVARSRPAPRPLRADPRIERPISDLSANRKTYQPRALLPPQASI